MNERQFKQRTKGLALRVIKLVEALPKETTANVISKQLLRGATPVDANRRVLAMVVASIMTLRNKQSLIQNPKSPRDEVASPAMKIQNLRGIS